MTISIIPISLQSWPSFSVLENNAIDVEGPEDWTRTIFSRQKSWKISLLPNGLLWGCPMTLIVPLVIMRPPYFRHATSSHLWPLHVCLVLSILLNLSWPLLVLFSPFPFSVPSFRVRGVGTSIGFSSPLACFLPFPLSHYVLSWHFRDGVKYRERVRSWKENYDSKELRKLLQENSRVSVESTRNY